VPNQDQAIEEPGLDSAIVRSQIASDRNDQRFDPVGPQWPSPSSRAGRCPSRRAASLVASALVTTTPTSLAFPVAPVNTPSGPLLPITITNASAAALAVPLRMTGSDAGSFVVASTTCPVGGATLAAGAS
jgi:hypothetical protein